MTASPEHLTRDVALYPGDCLAVLPTLAENSIDSIVTDPPYGLEFMGKDWDRGVPGVRYWRAMFRALKPGGHLLSFGGTRTYHRMACAIEDAGFEIRDCIQWLYGSGFPKSRDVSKAIDAEAGAERPILGQYVAPDGNPRGINRGIRGGNFANGRADYVAENLLTAPATDAAREWNGWGTALKPACELICLARKPLSESTVAANVLRWGTGALNIDGCRIEWLGREDAAAAAAAAAVGFSKSRARGTAKQSHSIGKESRDGQNTYDPTALSGRWPANVIHDGSNEVLAAFPDVPGQIAAVRPDSGSGQKTNGILSTFAANSEHDPRGDSGSAARFFYCAKADANDRCGSKHPTVKPVALIRYLTRLITPPRGLVSIHSPVPARPAKPPDHGPLFGANGDKPA